MPMPKVHAAAIAMLVVGGVTIATDANAQSFAIRNQGALGAGMAFAGAASGGAGNASTFWNPATITLLPGRQSNWNFTGILPSANYRTVSTTNPFQTGGTGEIGLEGAFLTASYSSWQITDDLWLGVTTGSPYGLRSKPENQNFAGQTFGRSSTARSINVTPTLGYKVNDWLSVGVGVQIQYFLAELRQAYGFPPTVPLAPQALAPNAPNSVLRADDITFGYRLGATLKPFEGTTIGIGFRSAIHHQLDGNFSAPVSIPGAPPAGPTPIRVNLNLPETINVGLSQVIDDQWTVHFTGEWQNWSRFGRLPVVVKATGAVLSSLNFVYQDSFHVAGGVEYQWSPALTLRAGLAYDFSPVTDDVRGVRISDADRLWVSGGFSYKFSEQLRFDFGYTHIFVADAPVNVQPGHPDFTGLRYSAIAQPSIDIVSGGITYRWDTPVAAAAPARPPIVKKF